MSEPTTQIRLFIEFALAGGLTVPLQTSQVHYLRNVLRRKGDDEIRLFNGRDGEWLARLGTLGRNHGDAEIVALKRPHQATIGPGLIFAPLQKQPMALLVQKATELAMLNSGPAGRQMP